MLETGTLADDPALEDDLFAAFPAAMREAHAESIRAHRLRREIVATRVANRLVNRLGLLAAEELAEEEGVSGETVARAFLVIERLYDLPALWDAIESAAMAETVRIALFRALAQSVRGQIADLIRTGRCTGDIAGLTALLRPGIAELTRELDRLLAPDIAGQIDADEAALVAQGADAGIAHRVEMLDRLDGAVGIAELAARSGTGAAALAESFILLGARLGLGWAQGVAARMNPRDPWERTLAAGLARDLQRMRIDFLARAEGPPAGFVDGWLADQAAHIGQFAELVARARRAPEANVAMLAQIAGQARLLLSR
jgi:glutamate dehydrogenase